MAECKKCIKDEFNTMKGAFNSNKWLLRAVATFILVGGIYNHDVVNTAIAADSEMKTQIALNAAAIEQLVGLAEQNRIEHGIINLERKAQTQIILRAIESLK